MVVVSGESSTMVFMVSFGKLLGVYMTRYQVTLLAHLLLVVVQRGFGHSVQLTFLFQLRPFFYFR